MHLKEKHNNVKFQINKFNGSNISLAMCSIFFLSPKKLFTWTEGINNDSLMFILDTESQQNLIVKTFTKNIIEKYINLYRR